MCTSFHRIHWIKVVSLRCYRAALHRGCRALRKGLYVHPGVALPSLDPYPSNLEMIHLLLFLFLPRLESFCPVPGLLSFLLKFSGATPIPWEQFFHQFTTWGKLSESGWLFQWSKRTASELRSGCGHSWVPARAIGSASFLGLVVLHPNPLQKHLAMPDRGKGK